jgi:hypothetical protein
MKPAALNIMRIYKFRSQREKFRIQRERRRRLA